MIEGAAGQSLAALLGYRFERSLRESGDGLARYILPARRFAALLPSAAPEGPGPHEAIGSADVVDGVRLLERWRDDRAGVLTGLGGSRRPGGRWGECSRRPGGHLGRGR